MPKRQLKTSTAGPSSGSSWAPSTETCQRTARNSETNWTRSSSRPHSSTVYDPSNRRRSSDCSAIGVLVLGSPQIPHRRPLEQISNHVRRRVLGNDAERLLRESAIGAAPAYEQLTHMARQRCA